MEINFDGDMIIVTSEHAGTATPWGEKYVKQHYVIKIQVNDVTFQSDYYCNNSSLDEKELANAVYCSLSDAMCYADASDIDDFSEEFGYTKISESIKAYNGCKQEYYNWESTSVNIYDFADWIQEKYHI